MKRFLFYNFRVLYAIREWILRRFTWPGLLILFGMIASAVVGLDTNRSLAYQVFTFLVCILVLSMLFSLRFRADVQVQRTLPKFGTVGEPLVYRLEIVNRGRKPLRNLVILELPEDPRPAYREFLQIREPGETRRNPFDRIMGFYRWEWLVSRNRRAVFHQQNIPVIAPGDRQTVRMTMTPTARGRIRLDGLTVARPDPLGLFNALKPLTAPASVLVLPKRYPLPGIRLPGIRRYHSGGVALTSSVGDSEEFVSLRDYRFGDSLRRIHWKSWARTGKPVVKEFQGEFFVRYALILDTFTAEPDNAFEEAVSVAASFACTIQTQESLLDLIFVGTESYCFTTGRGLGQTDRTLEILAAVDNCPDRTFDELAGLVLSRAATLSGCVCILLDWDPARESFISRLRGYRIPVLVLVISDRSTGMATDENIMSDAPVHIRHIRPGAVPEGLAAI